MKMKKGGMNLKKIVVLLGLILTLFLSYTALCSIANEGMSFTAWRCLIKTNSIINAIESQDYERAVKQIGFLNQSREISEQQWINRTEQLFSEEITLKEINLERFSEDDGLVRGEVMMKIDDSVSMKEYLIEIMIIHQDHQMAFAYPRISDDSSIRACEIEKMVYEAMSSYNPG